MFKDARSQADDLIRYQYIRDTNLFCTTSRVNSRHTSRIKRICWASALLSRRIMDSTIDIRFGIFTNVSLAPCAPPPCSWCQWRDRSSPHTTHTCGLKHRHSERPAACPVPIRFGVPTSARVASQACPDDISCKRRGLAGDRERKLSKQGTFPPSNSESASITASRARLSSLEALRTRHDSREPRSHTG